MKDFSELKLCETQWDIPASSAVTDLLLLVFLLPFHISFATFFLHRLVSKSAIRWTTPMVRWIIGYIVLSSISLCFAYLMLVIEPIRMTKFAPNISLCAAYNFFGWTASDYSHFALLEISLQRLESCFECSIFEISPKVIHAFHLTFVITLLFGTAVKIIYTVQTNCWIVYGLGFLGRSTLFSKKNLLCGVNESTLWLGLLHNGTNMLVICVCSVTLVYMFVTRLKESDPDQTEEFDKVAEKAGVVCCVGLISTICAMTVAATSGRLIATFIDSTVNIVLLYLLFSFGEQWYQRSLGLVVRKMTQSFTSIPRLSNISSATQPQK